jgi:hypothetical protein
VHPLTCDIDSVSKECHIAGMETKRPSGYQRILSLRQHTAGQAFGKKWYVRIAYVVVLLAALYVAVLSVCSLGKGYLATRSDAHLAVTLARLGAGTPLDDYRMEFGPPVHRFTEPDLMASWGPSRDENLLSKTDLYYFGYWGRPHRFVVVYVDKSTQRSVFVTWKLM